MRKKTIKTLSLTKVLDVVRSADNPLKNLPEDEVEEWLLNDENEPVEQELTDKDIINIVVNPQPTQNLEESDSDAETEEKKKNQLGRSCRITKSLLLLRLVLATVLQKLLISISLEINFILNAKSQENKKTFVTFLNLSEICFTVRVHTLYEM